MAEADHGPGDGAVLERDLDILDALNPGVRETHDGHRVPFPEVEELAVDPGVTREIAQGEYQDPHRRAPSNERVRAKARQGSASTILNWI